MKKKVIQLTEEELHNLIKECVENALNEMDGATYARLHNASQRAMNDMQNGNATQTVGKKVINNDDTITRATNMQPAVQQYWLKDYIGKTFKFFAQDRLGLVAHVLFTFDKVTKLDVKKTILVGTVTYNATQISGDGITIDLSNNKVYYHERGSRYKYNLVADNRTAPIWNKLLEQLRMTLDKSKKIIIFAKK